MFCHLMLLLITVVLLSSVVPAADSNEDLTGIVPDCALTRITSQLSVVSEMIQNTRLILPTNSGRSLCEKTPTDRTESPCQEKPIDCTKCSCEEKPIDCTKCSPNYSECLTIIRNTKPRDCSDIYKNGNHEDGSYEIWLQNGISHGSLRVYCDMQDGGGWTVIQRRGDFGNPSDYFYRDWKSYKEGFGNILKEFWIGNDNLFALTNQTSYRIKFDLGDWNNNSKYAIYNNFYIDDETHFYTVHFTGYEGTAGDSFSHHKGMKFSTKDKDNDQHPEMNCAVSCTGAWWYNLICCLSNLNGEYRKQQKESSGGVNWYTFRQTVHYSLRDVIMKIRPMDY